MRSLPVCSLPEATYINRIRRFEGHSLRFSISKYYQGLIKRERKFRLVSTCASCDHQLAIACERFELVQISSQFFLHLRYIWTKNGSSSKFCVTSLHVFSPIITSLSNLILQHCMITRTQAKSIAIFKSLRERADRLIARFTSHDKRKLSSSIGSYKIEW